MSEEWTTSSLRERGAYNVFKLLKKYVFKILMCDEVQFEGILKTGCWIYLMHLQDYQETLCNSTAFSSFSKQSNMFLCWG